MRGFVVLKTKSDEASDLPSHRPNLDSSNPSYVVRDLFF